jgi:hypothetical protein
MTNAAIRMDWDDGTVGYIVVSVHEMRNDGPRFRVADGALNGAHILSANDIRANWNAWVSDLIDIDEVHDEPPPGVEIY